MEPDPMICRFATQAQGTLDPSTGRKRKPWGFLIHTTGGGPARLAIKEALRRGAEGRNAIQIALDVYRSSQHGSNGYLWGGPTYVVGWSGVLWQLAPDDVRTEHAGGSDRESYLSGAWEKKCPAELVARWRAQWPRRRNPCYLYPSKSPNTDYVGIEMLQLPDGSPDAAYRGARFTAAQIAAVTSIGRDLAERHTWPSDWASTSRLVGHEDVQPMRRSQAAGGWDPGYLRRGVAWFPFDSVRAALAP